MRLPFRNPLVDGPGDAMLCAVRNFFVIGHLLSADMNEWVEVITAEAGWMCDRHVGKEIFLVNTVATTRKRERSLPNNNIYILSE